MSLFAEGRPFLEVASDLAASVGVSISTPAGGALPAVSVTFDDLEAEEAFKSLAAQASLSVRFEKGVVKFTDAKGGRSVYAFFNTGYDTAADLVTALDMVLPEEAEVKVIGGRVFVAGDGETIRRAGEMIEHAEAAGPDGWQLEVSVIAVSESLRRQLGLAWTVGGRFGVVGDVGVGNQSAAVVPALGARAAVAVNILAQAAEEGREASLVTTGILHVLEGGEGELQQGEIFPIPKRTISAEGQVTTIGFESVKTGFNMIAKCRRVPDGVHVTMTPKLSAVTAIIEGHPVVTERSISAGAVLHSGDWILLSGLEAAELSRESNGIPGLPASRLFGLDRLNADRRALVVAVRATRVYAAGVSQ